MPTRVATIDAVFSIEGIGTVVALPKEDRWAINPKDTVHRGERVQIRTKNGDCLSTFIEEIEMINRGRNGCVVAFRLPRPITPKDIPEGSELWLERDGIEPPIQT